MELILHSGYTLSRYKNGLINTIVTNIVGIPCPYQKPMLWTNGCEIRYCTLHPIPKSVGMRKSYALISTQFVKKDINRKKRNEFSIVFGQMNGPRIWYFSNIYAHTNLKYKFIIYYSCALFCSNRSLWYRKINLKEKYFAIEYHYELYVINILNI